MLTEEIVGSMPQLKENATLELRTAMLMWCAHAYMYVQPGCAVIHEADEHENIFVVSMPFLH